MEPPRELPVAAAQLTWARPACTDVADLAARDPLDCESVQFVSGIAVADGGDDLVVSYGVSDCEAKAASVPLRSVWAALVPRGGAGETCVGTS